MKTAQLVSLAIAAISYTSGVNAKAEYKFRHKYDVSVCKDATYKIHGPICSGPVNHPATGTACPKAGDVAVRDCHKHLTTYVDHHKCVAKEDAVCEELDSGAWGCVFPSLGCDYYKEPEYPLEESSEYPPKDSEYPPEEPPQDSEYPPEEPPKDSEYPPEEPPQDSEYPPEEPPKDSEYPPEEPPKDCPTHPQKPENPKHCKRPLNYQGCANDSVGCGDFGGFQLECNTDGNPGGQCRCPVHDKLCRKAVEQSNVAFVRGKATKKYLPHFGTNCNKSKGCVGHGQLCNAKGEWGHCSTCQEPVKCIANTHNFYQCHTCSSCREHGGYFDCSSVCPDY